MKIKVKNLGALKQAEFSLGELTIICSYNNTGKTFEIDGVFLPPDNDTLGRVYFCEVQFQKDEILYE